MKEAGSLGVLVSEANESREDAASEGSKIPLAAGAEAPTTAQERSDEQERLPVAERSGGFQAVVLVVVDS